MKTHTITRCAIMTALLIVVQFALSSVAGVELVTILFISFICVFGMRYGVIVANAFCALRCIVFGFYPNVVVLYAFYYNFVAVYIGAVFNRKRVMNGVALIGLVLVAAACAYFAVRGVPVSIMYQASVSIMLWALFGLCLALIVLHIVLSLVPMGSAAKEIAVVTSLAVVCTVLFTLADDVITPLIYGYGFDVAVGYFYSSFTVLLPHAVSVALSALVLYYPLKKAMLAVNTHRDAEQRKGLPARLCKDVDAVYNERSY